MYLLYLLLIIISVIYGMFQIFWSIQASTLGDSQRAVAQQVLQWHRAAVLAVKSGTVFSLPVVRLSEIGTTSFRVPLTTPGVLCWSSAPCG